MCRNVIIDHFRSCIIRMIYTYYMYKCVANAFMNLSSRTAYLLGLEYFGEMKGLNTERQPLVKIGGFVGGHQHLFQDQIHSKVKTTYLTIAK